MGRSGELARKRLAKLEEARENTRNEWKSKVLSYAHGSLKTKDPVILDLIKEAKITEQDIELAKTTKKDYEKLEKAKQDELITGLLDEKSTPDEIASNLFISRAIVDYASLLLRIEKVIKSANLDKIGFCGKTMDVDIKKVFEYQIRGYTDKAISRLLGISLSSVYGAGSSLTAYALRD